VTVYAHGCNGVQLVFLGPLDYIGSGGGGETLPGVVTKKNGPTSGKTFVVPLKYLAGGDLDGTVAVSAAGRYQFGSYPADVCIPAIADTCSGSKRTPSRLKADRCRGRQCQWSLLGCQVAQPHARAT
jgi:hypothetical protein